MSTCLNCGTPVDDGTAFCPKCGTQTGDPGAATIALSAMPDDDPVLRQLKTELAEDYEVEKELGRGGMAVVYKGKEHMLERTVAIKVLPPEMAHAGDTAERFKREARLAASLDHPNIIPIYRVGQKGELYFMAMKFVEGRALDSIIEIQGALPFAVVIKVLEASASALAFAHERGIIHRDIKGGNILIDTDGRVMVSDFGIARAMGETGLTATGMVVGTPNYMSPEQCGGLELGPQSDQYSLGVLGFQMLTGQLPFDADSIMGVIQHHYLTPPPDITEVRQGVPEELLAVVYKLMEKKPTDRFAATGDLVDALMTVPVTDVEKREGGGLLKELAKGVKIDMVRTGSLPPLRLSSPDKMPKGLKRASRALQGKKRSKLVPTLATVVVLAGGGAAAYQFAIKPDVPATSQTPPGDAAAPAAAATQGLAIFLGLPDDATINIGGQIYTDRNLTLDEGTFQYTIRAAGYQDYTATVTVSAGAEIPVRPALVRERTTPARTTPARTGPARPTGTATLNVSVTPALAEVFLDNERIGAGRIARREIPAGRHRLRVVLAGYATVDTTFVVAANGTFNLTGLQLQPGGTE